MPRFRRRRRRVRRAPAGILPWLLTAAAVALTLLLARAAATAYGQSLVVILGLMLTFALLPPPLRRLVGYVETYAHEVCHGLAGLLVGGRWHRFRVDAAGGGVCLTLLPAGPRALLVAAAGYLGVIALGSSALAAAAFPRFHLPALLLLLILLAFPLPRAGSFLTFLIGAAASTLVMLALIYLRAPSARDDLALALRLFGAALVAAGFDSLRQLLLIVRAGPRRRGAVASDAHVIARATGLPPTLVTLLAFLAGAGLVLVALWAVRRWS